VVKSKRGKSIDGGGWRGGGERGVRREEGESGGESGV